MHGTIEACEAIHACVKQCVEQAKAAICFELDEELIAQAERILNLYGWTLEEQVVLFCMWCVVCPDKLQAWWARKESVNPCEEDSDIVQA